MRPHSLCSSKGGHLRGDHCIIYRCVLWPGMRAESVKAELLGTTEVSMDFFDRLRDEGLVREEGSIQKCFDEFHEDMLLSHSLAQVGQFMSVYVLPSFK